jgi:PHD/YefM family antitoxin component YafN of YafNO toxin-antitoxin module
MSGLDFIPIFTFNKKATQIIAKIEKTGRRAIITRHGRPAVLVERATAGDAERGKREMVSNVKNHTNEIIREIEEKGTRYVVTRFDEPVVILRRVSSRELSIS